MNSFQNFRNIPGKPTAKRSEFQDNFDEYFSTVGKVQRQNDFE